MILLRRFEKVRKGVIVGLLGCLAVGFGWDKDIVYKAFELTSARAVEHADGKVQSDDGRVVLVTTLAHLGDFDIYPIKHLPETLTGHIQMAYRVSSSTHGAHANLTIHYDESWLPVGVDEADLILGKAVNNRWEEIEGARVDVLANTVSAPIFSSDPTSIYGLLVRPYPVFLNASFDSNVSEEQPNGWTFTAQSDLSGGLRNVNGNPMFLIRDAGQVGSDPSLSQTVQGFTPGRAYQITGLFGRYDDCCESENISSFGVAVDGQVILKRSRPLNEGLVPFIATLQATAASHEISFLAERNGSRMAYYVDDLVITPERGFRLNVNKKGGGGTILSYPAGIDCGAVCSSSFSSGRSVTLIVQPEQGFIFQGFTDRECHDREVCTLTLDSTKTVTATFTKGKSDADLVDLIALSHSGQGEALLSPLFSSNQQEYTVSRIERAGWITFIAKAKDSGAGVQVGSRVIASDQSVPIYFNGDESVVPIVVTAQDGKTVKEYVVRLCKWYCSSSRGNRAES